MPKKNKKRQNESSSSEEEFIDEEAVTAKKRPRRNRVATKRYDQEYAPEIRTTTTSSSSANKVTTISKLEKNLAYVSNVLAAYRVVVEKLTGALEAQAMEVELRERAIEIMDTINQQTRESAAAAEISQDSEVRIVDNVQSTSATMVTEKTLGTISVAEAMQNMQAADTVQTTPPVEAQEQSMEQDLHAMTQEFSDQQFNFAGHLESEYTLLPDSFFQNSASYEQGNDIFASLDTQLGPLPSLVEEDVTPAVDTNSYMSLFRSKMITVYQKIDKLSAWEVHLNAAVQEALAVIAARGTQFASSSSSGTGSEEVLSLQRQLENTSLRCDELKRTNAKLTSKIAELQKKSASHSELFYSNQRLRTQNLSAASEKGDLLQQINDLKTERAGLIEHNKTLSSEKDSLMDRNSSLSTKLNEHIERSLARLDQLEKFVKKGSGAHPGMLQILSSEVSKLQMQAGSLKITNRLEELKASLARYEPVSNSSSVVDHSSSADDILKNHKDLIVAQQTTINKLLEKVKQQELDIASLKSAAGQIPQTHTMFAFDVHQARLNSASIMQVEEHTAQSSNRVRLETATATTEFNKKHTI